ncbi:NrsF family protein [Ancylobacter sp. MQZ15Z-1]|uniref:NrsF family protein n=1 Tax=Ancylobacter mangrovi TaxID=2972472 RepID=A0A9X2PJP0_9HYPH|nr:NrsF family protein [Ancylobacter mangrovi]MCS0496442.1 NrsF family protein [Ancylobacter mangrovi]
MKTDDLIELLAEDATPQWPFRRLFDIALLAAVAACAVAFFATIGPRPDFAHAAETVRFPFKFVVTLTLATGAVGLSLAMARPGVRTGPWLWLLAAAPLLLLAGVAAELAVVPREAWMTRLVGHNSAFCLRVIPLLAVAPLACFLLVLRRGAPAHAGRAGALAGLAAGGIAATFYAAHCPDDSPLFVAVWYSVAIAIVTAAGYLGGRRLLAW